MQLTHVTALLSLLSFGAAMPASVHSSTHNVTLPDLSSVVYQNLNSIGYEILALNKTLNSMTNSSHGIPFFTLLSLQTQSLAVGEHIVAATKAANMSSTWTAAESQNITTLAKGLEANVSSLLTNFLAHQTAFKSEGVSSLVATELKVQRELTREEGNAIQSKLASPYATQSSNETAQILLYFDAAIAAFSPARMMQSS